MPESYKNIYFNVSNFEQNRSKGTINNEVALRYRININLPENANLPLDYELFRIENGTETEITLENGKSAWVEVATECEIHEYRLYIKWRDGEKDISYKNLTDNIKISIELEQID